MVIEILSFSISPDSSPAWGFERPFLEKSGANRLQTPTQKPRRLAGGENTRSSPARSRGPHGRFRRAAVLLDRIPHALAKFSFATRPTTSSPRLRVLPPVRNTLWERERRLKMRPRRSPLNRAWSRYPVIIVSSTYITCSANDAHRHTLSVKCTGDVHEKSRCREILMSFSGPRRPNCSRPR